MNSTNTPTNQWVYHLKRGHAQHEINTCNRLQTVKSFFNVYPAVTMSTSTARPRDGTFVPSPNSKKALFASTVRPHFVTLAGEMKF